MKRYHQLTILAQIQKVAPADKHRLGFGLRPVGNNALKALVHIVHHGDFPCSAGGFRILYVDGAVPPAVLL